MAGVAGRSGGARIGAGRKPKAHTNSTQPYIRKAIQGHGRRAVLLKDDPPVTRKALIKEAEPTPIPAVDNPLEFLEASMNDIKLPHRARLRAAITLAQYKERRTRDGGKKEAAQEAAQEEINAGTFAPGRAPTMALLYSDG